MYWNALNMSEKRLLRPSSAMERMLLSSCFFLNSSSALRLGGSGAAGAVGMCSGTGAAYARNSSGGEYWGMLLPAEAGGGRMSVLAIQDAVFVRPFALLSDASDTIRRSFSELLPWYSELGLMSDPCVALDVRPGTGARLRREFLAAKNLLEMEPLRSMSRESVATVVGRASVRGWNLLDGTLPVSSSLQKRSQANLPSDVL